MEPQRTSRRRFPRWALIVLVVVGVGLVGSAGAAIGAAVTGSSESSRSESSDQAAGVRAACREWADANPSQAQNGGWCGAMTDWMLDHAGHGAGPAMMWGDAARTRDACEQWMTSDPPNGESSTDARAWCGSMVTWMTEHMGNWSDSGAWGHGGGQRESGDQGDQRDRGDQGDHGGHGDMNGPMMGG